MAVTAPKAPSRSMSKMVIQFGLISVPVQIFNGVEDDANKFPRSMRGPSGKPINYVTLDSGTGEVVARGDTFKVYVAEDGTEIPLTDEDMEAALTMENGTCELVGFYDAALVGTHVTKQIFQVRPQTMKTGSKVSRPYDRAFALLMAAMRARGTFALLRYVVRGNMHLGGLLPTGDLLEFYWPNEVRQSMDMPEVEVTEAEVALATQLLDTMTEDSVPALENPVADTLRKFIAAKVESGEKAVAPASPEGKAVTADLLAQLEATMANLKAGKVKVDA